MSGWLFAFHVLGLVFWVATLLFSTKLLALHGETQNPDAQAILARLGRTLLMGWGLPGLAVVWASGVWLVLNNPSYYMRAGWFHTKLALVLALAVLHGWLYLRGQNVFAGRARFGRGLSAALHAGISLAVVVILVLVFTKP